MPNLTKGEVNKLIDAVVHPLFRKSKAFIIVDGVAHTIVEQNTKVSIRKFIKYDLEELIR